MARITHGQSDHNARELPSRTAKGLPIRRVISANVPFENVSGRRCLRGLFSVAYERFYSARVSIRLHSLRLESTPKRATNCAARARLQHDWASPGRQTAASRRTPHEPRLPSTSREIRLSGGLIQLSKSILSGPRLEGGWRIPPHRSSWQTAQAGASSRSCGLAWVPQSSVVGSLGERSTETQRAFTAAGAQKRSKARVRSLAME